MMTIEEVSLLLTNAGLATKADLANMVTKADMANMKADMVTKADIAELRVNISEPEDRGDIFFYFLKSSVKKIMINYLKWNWRIRSRAAEKVREIT